MEKTIQHSKPPSAAATAGATSGSTTKKKSGGDNNTTMSQEESTMSSGNGSDESFSIDSICHENHVIQEECDKNVHREEIQQPMMKVVNTSKCTTTTTNPFVDSFDSNSEASASPPLLPVASASPVKTNPFYDDDDSQEIDADDESINKMTVVKPVLPLQDENENASQNNSDSTLVSSSIITSKQQQPVVVRSISGNESISTNNTATSVDGDLFSGFQSMLLHRNHQKVEQEEDDLSEIPCEESVNEEVKQPSMKDVKKSKSTTNPFVDSFDSNSEVSSSPSSVAPSPVKTNPFYDDDDSQELDADESMEKMAVVKPVQLCDTKNESHEKTNPFYDDDSQEFDADESMEKKAVSEPDGGSNVVTSPSGITSTPVQKSSNPFDLEDSSQEFDADESMEKKEESSPVLSYDAKNDASSVESSSMASSSIVTPKPVEKSGNPFDLEESSQELEEDESIQENQSIKAPVKDSEFARNVTPSPKKWSAESASIESSSLESSSDSAFHESAHQSTTETTKNPFIADATPPTNDAAPPKKKWQMGVDSFDSSVDSSSDALPIQEEVKSTNPFADILAMRAKERKTNNWIVQQMMKRDSDISQIELESSSQEDNLSEVSPAADQGTFVIEDTDRVKTNPFDESVTSGTDLDNDSGSSSSSESSSSNDNSSESASLGGTIFTDVRRALSNIQSVSYETNEEESKVDVDCVDEDEDQDDSLEEEVQNVAPNKPDFNVSQSEAFNEYSDESSSVSYMAPLKHVSTESCAVSSLKTTDFKAAPAPGFDVNESFDDEEEVASIPKCPTSFESAYNIGVMESMKKNDFAEKQVVEFKATKSKKHLRESKKVAGSDRCKPSKVREEALLRSAPTSDTATAESIERVVNILPPKKHVVLPDGSISTKDSIVGKTIRVTNADMVAERIYLESLRAQVHAELKVHVADEEIRVALEGRLNAIRDFYKRKTTTAQLKCSHDNDNIAEVASFASNPKCPGKPGKPKILRDGSVDPISPKSAMTDVSSLSYPKGPTAKGKQDSAAAREKIASHIKLPSPIEDLSAASFPKGVTMNSSTPDDQKLAYKKAEANIQGALEAANLSTSPSDNLNLNEEQDEESDEEDEVMGKIACQGTVPANVYPNKTFSFDDEDVAVPKSLAAKSQVDVTVPAVKDAWSFYRQINNLMSDNRVYDYEFEAIQKDPLYPYLNSLTGIADSGDDGLSSTDKKVKQRMREEFKSKSPHRICHILAKEAKEIQPELIEVCEDIARKLNMHTMAVGAYII